MKFYQIALHKNKIIKTKETENVGNEGKAKSKLVPKNLDSGLYWSFPFALYLYSTIV